jgi:hypothetical protein
MHLPELSGYISLQSRMKKIIPVSVVSRTSFTDTEKNAPLTPETALKCRKIILFSNFSSIRDLKKRNNDVVDFFRKQMKLSLEYMGSSLSEDDKDFFTNELSRKKFSLKLKSEYSYYYLFSLRLSMAATNKDARVENKRNNFSGEEVRILISSWRDHCKLEVRLNNCEDSMIKDNLNSFFTGPLNSSQTNPHSVLVLPTTLGDMPVYDVNKQIETGIWLTGLTPDSVVADDRDMAPIHFTWHDGVHLQNYLLTKNRIEIDLKSPVMSYHRYRETLGDYDCKIMDFIFLMAFHEAAFGFEHFGQCDKNTPEGKSENVERVRAVFTERDALFDDPRWYKPILPNGKKDIDRWMETYAKYLDFHLARESLSK